MSARKILLVDDSKSARYALRLLLKKRDLEVDTAESAEVALEKIKAELPDAIFMDHLMPGMNGFEALEALKGDPRTQHIPIVMCTSNDEEPYQRQAREKGALGILPKPADQAKLGAVLQAVEASIAGQATPALQTAAPARPAVQATPAQPDSDGAAIAARVKGQVHYLLQTEIKPYINMMVDSRMEELDAEVTEKLLAASAVRLEEWTDDALARVREESSRVDSDAATTKLNARLDEEFGKLRGELVRMETEHAQAVVQKISQEILPELVQSQIDSIEQQLFNQLDSRIEEFTGQMAEGLPKNDRFMRLVSEMAETAAEHKAAEIATAHAHQAAESSAEEKASEMTDFFMSSAESANQRMYLLAGGAAALGVLSSALVYFMVG